MAKNMLVTWLGDGDPQSQIITEGGVRFIKGEAVKVPEDVTYNGVPWAANFKANPTFAVDEEAHPVVLSEDEERAALMSELDRKGIAHRKNAHLDTLRGLLAN